jgi:hypothetical protein
VGEIVELCNGAYARREGRMRRHVGHSLTVQQHRATITQAAHILVAASSHTVPFLTLHVFATAPPRVSTFIGFCSLVINGSRTGE